MPESTTLQSQYALQVQSDLESNGAERERITAEINVLQEQLTVLEGNHVLLTAMQQTLGTRTPPAATARKKTKEAAPAGGRVPRARISADTPATGAKKQKQTAAKTRARRNGPTLRELVATHLSDTREPRLAAEVTNSLTTAHPDRNIAGTVVRSTLENLVAKGQAERTRQNRSVFYSLPANPSGTRTLGDPQGTALRETTPSGATA
ncbi:hypothetical protein [Streptomyces violascens]|uniref:Regulatory protein n=1 Tax=Streptomyces violascens TaxID=67381 RepID=A0ABQ3QRQ5_9ACTN|nr:hypothetical protein [Streptomyces violascens]GGU42483.1 hypothetical protein GCM10010289_74000 [Streptomyces violascens]GHI39953.1 hypothetical protein Sviol_43610 [Streptomyces violascens]